MGRKTKNSYEKYNYEQKLKAVLAVIENYQTFRSAAAEIGTDKESVRRWVGLYKQFGTEGLLIKKRDFSLEFKLSIIRYMQENRLSFFKTAIEFGITNDSVLRKWYRIYNEHGVLGLMSKNLYRNNGMRSGKPNQDEKTREELLKELEYLRAENAYLKKLQALVQERIAVENEKRQKRSKN